MQLTIAEIKKLFPKNTISKSDDVVIAGINRDSRKIVQGEIYAAIRGENFDGNNFVDSALKNGAVAAFVDKPGLLGENLIFVDDVVLALGVLAKYYRSKFTQPVVAITGSNGKTTTKEFLVHVLSSEAKVIATQGNLNNHIGVPVTVFRFSSDAGFFVVEMGMNHFGEIDYLTKIVSPDLALITSVGRAHLEGVGGTLEGVAQAKSELFAALNPSATALIFQDDPYISKMATSAKKLAYGFSSQSEIWVSDIQSSGGQTSFKIHEGDHQWLAKIQMVGLQHVQNALSVFAAASRLGMKREKIIENLGTFRIDFNRGRRLEKSSMVIIDDSYNANPDSMRAALQSFCAEFVGYYKIAVLGDMGELGEKSEALHEEVGLECAKLGIDLLLCCGSHAKLYCKGFGDAKRCDCLSDHKAIAVQIKMVADSQKKIALLVKGSHFMAMDKVIEML